MLSRSTQWTRIGIVLSILWALFVLAWAARDFSTTSRLVDGFYADCVASPEDNLETCQLMAQTLRESAEENIGGRVLWLSVVLIPVAWWLAYAVLAIVRGARESTQPESRLSARPPRR